VRVFEYRRVERAAELVDGQDVQAPVADERRGGGHRVQHAQHAGPDLRRGRPAGSPGGGGVGRPGQVEQVGPFSLVQVQGPGDRVQDAVGDAGQVAFFGQLWPRPELSPKERSLITVAALTAGGNTEQLVFHLGLAKQNATETELIEAIIHLAFYAGWPKAMSAMAVAKQVFRSS
jgi:4-carboxymuconolactone decarboxylase